MASDPLQLAIDERVRSMLAQTQTPGAAVALTVDGRTIYAEGVGVRAPGCAIQLEANDQFYIYSITKMFLAAITLKLAQNGQIELDAPVQHFLPDLPVEAEISVRQLLNHTGGLPDYGSLSAYNADLRANPGKPWTPDQFFTRTLEGGMAFAPGDGWAYSNLGYLIVRQLIERVSDATFRTVLDEQIAKPLGLQHTFVSDTREDSAVLTPGFSTVLSQTETLENVAPLYHPGWVAHGVVISTAGEVARCIEELFNGEFLPDDLVQMMLQPTLVPDDHPLFQQSAYGLGVMIDAESPYGLLTGHGGGGPGYSLAALHFSNVAGHRVTSVALANRDAGEIGLRIAFELAAMLVEHGS
ncbi:serine hydrolase domain-containing protein [soil metagenome]